ncbi:MAG: acetyl-CoA C-acetyltransferase [Bdellovibrionales bacterium]
MGDSLGSQSMLTKVAVVGGKRVPFARSFTAYMGIPNQELMVGAMRALVTDLNLTEKVVGEVVLGSVIKHSSDWNLAREVTLNSGLSKWTPAYDLVQACGTSLQACIAVANKIRLGQIECGIAGGVDTNSDLPLVFSRKFSHALLKSNREKTFLGKLMPFVQEVRAGDLKPVMPGVTEPSTGLSMGQSCELMAKTWKIGRSEQDELAFQSHQNAARAWQEGFYEDLVTPFQGLTRDNNVRADTSLEKMANLKPSFDFSGSGTLTAANSSALTDGASCALLASPEWARKNNLPILAYLTHTETAAVEFQRAEGLLMAPAYAVPRMLNKAGLKLQDFDYYEIHEAFAAQVLCTLKAWESEEFCRQRLGLKSALGSIDRSKLNVKGGSVALGHPFAATGTRIVAGLAKVLSQKGSGRGLISICTGGGMGVTAILEANP